MPEAPPLRFALVGGGFMGAFHAQNLASHAGATLARVIDASATTAERVAALAPACRPSTRIDDAWQEDVDAVVIATPAETHADLICAAAAAGKAIFCEKPLATDLVGAQRAVTAVREAGVAFQLGFQRRYDPGIERLMATLRDGSLGVLETFRSYTFDPYGPDFETMQSSAGIFHDTLSHDVDLALALFGPVREVFTRGMAVLDPRFLDIGKPDTISVSLHFEAGTLGTIDARLRSGYGYETGLEVSGSHGKGVVRDDRVDALTLHQHNHAEHAFVPWFLERFERAYRRELDAFIAAVREGRDPEPKADHGAEVLRVCLACERSFLEDRRVHLGEIPLPSMPAGSP